MLRLKNSKVIKIAILFVILVFLWIQLHVLIGISFGGHGGSPTDVPLTLPPPPKNLTVEELDNITLIKQLVDDINHREYVFNSDIYGELRKGDIVIVIQIHDRRDYLRYLIDSLSKAKGINQTLVIFSHDFYDSNINALVERIDFVKVMQIFYPRSMQLYPNSFPGQSYNDCPRDAKKYQAIKLGCANARSPDLYGHYREAKYTQTKHHWWWKINYVFDGLQITRNHTGLVLFLEEDHYLAPDFLHLLRLMENVKNTHCAACTVLCLGTYMKTMNFAVDTGKIELWNWMSSKHNMGMAFNRSIWENIKRCSTIFCNFDEYNWDWTLQHVNEVCLKQRLIGILAKAPRIFHIGECGFHHKKADCSAQSTLNRVQKTIADARVHLFPGKLHLLNQSKRKMKIPKGNGGWGDTRDHALCLQHSFLSNRVNNYSLFSLR